MDVLLRLAYVLSLFGESEGALSLTEEVFKLVLSSRRSPNEGKALTLLCGSLLGDGGRPALQRREVNAKAITTLEQVEPTPELALAYLQASDAAMLSGGVPVETLMWADKGTRSS